MCNIQNCSYSRINPSLVTICAMFRQVEFTHILFQLVSLKLVICRKITLDKVYN